MGKSKSRTRISHEDFVRAWQSSQTTREVAARLGLCWFTVYGRARKYRKLGVRLKTMTEKKGPKLPDVASLNGLIDQLADSQAA